MSGMSVNRAIGACVIPPATAATDASPRAIARENFNSMDITPKTNWNCVEYLQCDVNKNYKHDIFCKQLVFYVMVSVYMYASLRLWLLYPHIKILFVVLRKYFRCVIAYAARTHSLELLLCVSVLLLYVQI